MDRFTYKELKLISDIIHLARTGLSRPNVWPEVLALTARLVNADSAVGGFSIGEGVKSEQTALYVMGPKLHEEYCSHFFANDTIPAAAEKAGHMIWRPEDILSDPVWRETEVYRDLLNRYGYYQALGSTVIRSPNSPVFMHFLRGITKQAFTLREISCIEILQPHLVNGYYVAQQNAEMAVVNEVLEKELDCVPSAMFVLNSDKRLLHMNDKAREVGMDLCVSPGEVLAQVVKIASSGIVGVALVDISGGKYRASASIVISSDGNPLYVVTLSKLGFRASSDDRKLSPRELEVSAMLAKGLSNDAIAEQLYISGYTVKDHVKNILRKLDLRSRSEIAARMLGI